MSLPLFLDIEVSCPDERQFPLAIAWTLPDGQIKSVLICPDDDWEPWENIDADIDLNYFVEQGMSGLDVIREMNQDLSGQTVFVDGLDDDEALLDKLFEAFQDEADFEIATLTSLFDSPLEAILDKRRQVAFANEFDINNSEDNVRCMLFMYSEQEA